MHRTAPCHHVAKLFATLVDCARCVGRCGVLVLCTETTKVVLAARQQKSEYDRQRRLFEQAPAFVIVMRGPERVVDFVSDAHRAVFNSTTWVGKTIRKAFPSCEHDQTELLGRQLRLVNFSQTGILSDIQYAQAAKDFNKDATAHNKRCPAHQVATIPLTQ